MTLSILGLYTEGLLPRPSIEFLRLLAVAQRTEGVPKLGYRDTIFESSGDTAKEAKIAQYVADLVKDERVSGLKIPAIESPDLFINIFRWLEICAYKDGATVTQYSGLDNFPLSFEGFRTIIVWGSPDMLYTRDSVEWKSAERIIENPKFQPSAGSWENHKRREDERQYNKREQEISDYLARHGFPYEDSYPEYVRYLDNHFVKMQFGNPKFIKGIEITLKALKALLFPYIPNHPEFKEAHTYIVGRGGSGKSELLKTIYEMAKSSRIVIDPHGDLSRDIASFTDGMDFLIAPKESPFVINPFDIDDPSPENRELVAQEITDLIAELVEDSGLSRLMTTIIFPIVYTLLKLEYADFQTLTACINPNSGKDKLKALRQYVEPHHLKIWEELESDTYDASKQSVFNRLQSLLNYQLIIKSTTGRDDFAEAIYRVEKGSSLIISLPIPSMGETVSSTLGKFFMTRLQIWAKGRQKIPERERVPVLLIIDEFHNFLSYSTAQTLDQFGRKFRLFMCFAHQHIQQIQNREIRGSVLANTANKIAGISNAETRQTMAKEMLIEPDALEDLAPGHFVGRFGNDAPFEFYARQVRNGREKTPFFTPTPRRGRKGGDIPNVWATLHEKNAKIDESATTGKATPKAGGYQPKFDI
jgi:hypothetical protein